MTLYTHQDSNVAKTWVLMATFFLVVIGLGWFFSAVYQAPEILWVAVILSIVMNVTSYWFSDTLVIKTSGAKPVSDTSHPDLYNIVENLSITAGIPMPKLYVIEDAAPNAFATGRNKEHASVAVTSGLLQILSRPELEGVIAHELSHIGNRDMLVSTVAVVLVGFVTLLSDFFLRMSMYGGGRGNDNRARGIIMILGFVLALLSPIIATLIQLAVSRKREFLADASGALLTRYPEGLASALEKIGAYSAPMKRANHATAHLFISNPFGAIDHERKVSFLTKLFMTHPPIQERVNALLGK